MAYLVDTHALAWFLSSNKDLGPQARRAMSDPDSTLIVPAMVLIELVFLWRRLKVDEGYRSALERLSHVRTLEVVAIDAEVVDHLPLGLNIHDVVIVASGIVWSSRHGEKVVVLTKDSRIKDSGLVEVLWGGTVQFRRPLSGWLSRLQCSATVFVYEASCGNCCTRARCPRRGLESRCSTSRPGAHGAPR